DIGEAGERDREVGPDPAAEAPDVGVGGGVAALVGALGIDDQAVGAAPGRGGTDLRLAFRVAAVDELAGADIEPAGVDRADEVAVELAPVVAGVAALHVDGVEAVTVRLAGEVLGAA